MGIFRAGALIAACCAMPGALAARCAPFDLSADIADVPYVVFGEVTRSNGAGLTGNCAASACTHSFDVRIEEVLKGEVTAPTLSISFDFMEQRPEMPLFAPGDRFVFALGEAGAEGEATLYGTTCGRAGADAARLDAVRQAAGGS